MPSITLAPFEFRLYVPADVWYPPPPAVVSFLPGHDARLLTIPGSANETSFDITFQFDQQMDCESLTRHLTITFTGGPGSSNPTIGPNPECSQLTNRQSPSELTAASAPVWQWKGTVTNAGDGIYDFQLGKNVSTYPAGDSTRVSPSLIRALSACSAYLVTAAMKAPAHFLVRKGKLDNVVVWTEEGDYSKELLTGSEGAWTLNHAAPGAKSVSPLLACALLRSTC